MSNSLKQKLVDSLDEIVSTGLAVRFDDTFAEHGVAGFEVSRPDNLNLQIRASFVDGSPPRYFNVQLSEAI